MIIHLTKDLLFCSRVGLAADELGIDLQTALGCAQLENALADQELQAVLVDLECPGFRLEDVAEWKTRKPALRVIAYGPHVQTDRLANAAAAGCDAVLSRGQFDRSIVSLLKELALPEP